MQILLAARVEHPVQRYANRLLYEIIYHLIPVIAFVETALYFTVSLNTSMYYVAIVFI